MSINRQSIYELTFVRLSEARKIGKDSEVRKALELFSDSLKNLVNETTTNPLVLSEFVVDERMFFPTIKNQYAQVGPDIEIRTTGLISQMLEMISIKDFEKVSTELNQALLDLHSRLSRGQKDISEEKGRLLHILDSFDKLL